jgi:lactate dehydrogenase-like 2-hydroxyacid dehydrogenase
MPTQLLTTKLPQPALESRLAEGHTLLRLHEKADRAGFIAARRAQVDAIDTTAPVGADAALTAALPNGKVIVGFGMATGYCNRTPLPDVGFTYHASPVALASWCDVLVVTTAGGVGTRHPADEAALVLDNLASFFSTGRPVTPVPWSA